MKGVSPNPEISEISSYSKAMFYAYFPVSRSKNAIFPDCVPMIINLLWGSNNKAEMITSFGSRVLIGSAS